MSLSQARRHALLAAVLTLSACADDDDDTGPEPDTTCSDEDQDGYGVGGGCLGDDCDEADPAVHDGCGENCDADPSGTGCPCGTEGAVEACYTGPAGSNGHGQCVPGLHECVGGAWGGCADQITPDEEICNELDDDCDGEVDEEVTNDCGTCHEDCEALSLGREGDQAWNLDEEGSPGLVLDPEGALTLRADTRLLPYIWIPNTGDATVTKLNTRTLEEEGRYALGPTGSAALGGISVNLDVDVVVSASIQGPRVTRVNLEDCRDEDGNGRLDTSASGEDVLDFGDDECVAWSTEIPTGQMGALTTVAWEQRSILDGVEYFVWVGDALGYRIFELTEDGDLTGREADVAPVQVAGIAVDPNGDLWAGSHGIAGHLARVDTDDLDVDTYVYAGQKYDCIAADAEGKIWITGLESTSAMFDPETEEFEDLSIDAWGISVDAEDYVWFGGLDGYVYRLDRETLEHERIDAGYGAGGFGFGYVYTAVDTDGQVWNMASDGNTARRFAPDDVDAGDVQTELAIDTLSMPGTCGDMTGTQLGYVTVPQGTYNHIFEGCAADAGGTHWRSLRYDALLEGGATMRVAARMADTVPGLLAAEYFDVGLAPGDASPLDLEAAIATAGLEPQTFLEIRVTLLPGAGDANPRLFSLEVLRACGAPVG